MYQHNIKEQLINPWTYRHRSTLDSFNQSKTNHFAPHEQRQNLKAQRTPIIDNLPHRQRHRQTQLRLPMAEHSERMHHYRIPKLSLEKTALQQIGKTLPFYTSVSFEAKLKPLKHRSNQNRFFIDSHSKRWKMQVLEALSKQQVKEMSAHRALGKMKRYYTEEKDYQDDQKGESFKKPLTNFLSVHPVSTSISPKPPIKIIITGKNNIIQDTITKGKLFSDIVAICQQKHIGGHLAQMKRNYNLKKIERFINPTHHDS